METRYHLDTEDRNEIERALKRASWKKVLYFYDACGARRLLGLFNNRNARRIKAFLRGRGLLGRVSEADVLTDHPDSRFSFSMVDKAPDRRRRIPFGRNA
jgi:hypothetical protein